MMRINVELLAGQGGYGEDLCAVVVEELLIPKNYEINFSDSGEIAYVGIRHCGKIPEEKLPKELAERFDVYLENNPDEASEFYICPAYSGTNILADIEDLRPYLEFCAKFDWTPAVKHFISPVK